MKISTQKNLSNHNNVTQPPLVPFELKAAIKTQTGLSEAQRDELKRSGVEEVASKGTLSEGVLGGRYFRQQERLTCGEVECLITAL